MTPGAGGLVRLAFWVSPFVFGYLAGRAWGRPRVITGLLFAALLLGALVRPYPFGWLLGALGFFSGAPLLRR